VYIFSGVLLCYSDPLGPYLPYLTNDTQSPLARNCLPCHIAFELLRPADGNWSFERAHKGATQLG